MQGVIPANAGLMTGNSWLKAGKSYPEINVEMRIRPIFTFYQNDCPSRKDSLLLKAAINQLMKIVSKFMLERH